MSRRALIPFLWGVFVLFVCLLLGEYARADEDRGCVTDYTNTPRCWGMPTPTPVPLSPWPPECSVDAEGNFWCFAEMGESIPLGKSTPIRPCGRGPVLFTRTEREAWSDWPECGGVKLEAAR